MFTILDADLLAKELLPRFFKHSKLDSFIRQVPQLLSQLNIYGFRKMKKSVAVNSFRHPYFVKGDRSNLFKIERRVNSRKGLQRTLSQPQLPKPDEQTSTA
jgi:heat shock transcription factor 1